MMCWWLGPGDMIEETTTSVGVVEEDFLSSLDPP